MKILASTLTLLLALIIPCSAYCEMYKWVDDDGNISYSDQPPFKGADTLIPPDISTLPTFKPTKPEGIAGVKPDSQTTSYQSLKITSPSNNDTVRDSQNLIVITLSIEPELNTAQGHYISILLDNKIALDKLTTSSANLSNVDRGSHQISAVVKDAQGKILMSSAATTIHVRRHSILHPKPL